MKRFLFYSLIILCLTACSADKSRCWTIYIEAFGLTETRLYWGTAEEVSVEARTIREASVAKGITASVYFEPTQHSRSDCK